MQTKAAGIRVERQWKHLLERQGHIVTRSPGSGIDREAFYDLMSFDHNGRGYLWEIKSVSRPVLYFHENELANISKLASAFQSHKVFPYLVVLFKVPGRFKVYKPQQVVEKRRIGYRDRGETWFAPQYSTYRKPATKKQEPRAEGQAIQQGGAAV